MFAVHEKKLTSVTLCALARGCINGRYTPATLHRSPTVCAFVAKHGVVGQRTSKPQTLSDGCFVTTVYAALIIALEQHGGNSFSLCKTA